MSVAIAEKLDFDFKNAIAKNSLIGLWRLMSGYRFRYITACTLVAVASLSKTATYLLLAYFTDNYLVQHNAAVSLPLIALGFIILALVEGSMSFGSGCLTAQTSEGIARKLRNYLFDHIQHLTFTYHNNHDTGELIERVTSDLDSVRRFYADQAIGFGRVILLFVINFTAITQLNLKLALTSIVVTPIIVGVSAFFFKRVFKAYEKYQEQEAVLTTALQENLSGVRVVKAFARQQYEIDKFEKENKGKFSQGLQLLKMNALFWPTTDIICGFQIVIGYLIGATMAISGEISLGSYLAYVGMITYIIFPMRNLGRLIVQISTGMVSYGRVMDIIKEDREPLDEGNYLPRGNLKGDITFNNVGFEYEHGHPVLEKINYYCKPGQVIALLGSTGSGKTTMVNLLPRFFEYTSGSILLDGVELNKYPRRYLRQQIGIVEQEPFLFSRSIRENIMYGVGRNVSQEEIIAAAKAAAIHDVILSFPDGYSTLVGEKGVTLSGGQKQRVAIARTILKNPRILILDDSTSSVDTETESEIRMALQNLMRNRTTFIIAHRIQSIMAADFILVLNDGHIVQNGTHEELVTRDGIYKQIFDIQTRIEVELEKEISNAG